MRPSEVFEHGFSEPDQRRIEELARKLNDGSLTLDERREYETYLRVGELASTLRSRERQRLREQTKLMPPRGDPRRPLYLSVRSLRLFGLVFLLLGCALFFAIAHVSVSLAFVALAPGIAHLILAAGLYQRWRWALMGAIAFASAQALAAITLVVLAISFRKNIFVIGAAVFWLAAVIQLLNHLRGSFHAIREQAFEGPAGFDVLPPVR